MHRRTGYVFLVEVLVPFVLSIYFRLCTHNQGTFDFNGLKAVDGSEPVSHINLTKFALHFAIVLPFLGDASLEGAVRDFTKEAKKEEAQRIQIVQSDETVLWWILPPISFLFTLRFTNVAGDALR
jgi:hypothetical protein